MSLKIGLFIQIFLIQFCLASTDEQISLDPGPTELQVLELRTRSISDRELYDRTQAVLDHFLVPLEVLDPNAFKDLDHLPSFTKLQSRLSLFDPFQVFKNFIVTTPNLIRVFSDFKSRQVFESEFNLNSQPQPSSLKARLLKAQKNAANEIFRGLKIALDPGHMGGTYWDKQTGKKISDGHNIVSEGLINLQVCLLLKKELENLGAEVLVTHESLAPVSSIDPNHFDLKEFYLREFRAQSMNAWFLDLISRFPIGEQLFKSFTQSRFYQQLISEKMRSTYFIKRADLDARVELMRQFNPDITLYIHHDAASANSVVNDQSPNRTRAFVPGSFQIDELATAESRQSLMRHWLDQDSWDLSLQLIRETLSQINQQMKIPLATSDGGQSVKIEDGIFARNLLVPRKMKNTLTAYYELFYYDRREEFNSLLQTKYDLIIDGKNYPYSNRIKQSVSSLRDGLVNFIKNLKE